MCFFHYICAARKKYQILRLNHKDIRLNGIRRNIILFDQRFDL